MIKIICASLSLFFLLSSCNKIETKVEITINEFENPIPISNVAVEVFEISNIQQNSNGSTFDRKLVDNLVTTSDGKINYSTSSNFERLEFDFTKNKYINAFSSDDFFIQQGDDLSLTMEMNKEAFIKLNVKDDLSINQGDLIVLVDVFKQGNVENIFTSGNAELIKQVRGNTETDVWITKNMNVTINNPTFVAAGDTFNLDIVY